MEKKRNWRPGQAVKMIAGTIANIETHHNPQSMN